MIISGIKKRLFSRCLDDHQEPLLTTFAPDYMLLSSIGQIHLALCRKTEISERQLRVLRRRTPKPRNSESHAEEPGESEDGRCLSTLFQLDPTDHSPNAGAILKWF
jgi:hypothetical protein